MTDPSLFREVDEDLERQRVNDMWRRYGPLTIIMAIVIVGCTAGYTAWHSWKIERDQKATLGLVTTLGQSRNAATVAASVDELQNFAHANKGQATATLAQLYAAALAATQGDKARAAQIYDGVAADEKADPAFRQFGTLMAVEMQMDTGDVAALQAKLQPLAVEGKPWRYSAMEDEAYLALRAGDKAKAKELFTQLSQATDAPPSLTARATDALRLLAE